MLELIKFEAKGFGCFKDETIFDFQSGINMIVAENGNRILEMDYYRS